MSKEWKEIFKLKKEKKKRKKEEDIQIYCNDFDMFIHVQLLLDCGTQICFFIVFSLTFGDSVIHMHHE